ncbi:flagellar basal-body MS-ring/collar protein FliF [Thermomonas sp.]|uniref:flagellar basal-body MS-ring/collar protein FliF n=1 Tax=Thermomonas sp. TaxID=1971895 RepID=UPI002C3A1444|nr:flagellar basal-body MS-ring/collar protein FliF [Thermomonas sp.]HRO63592.1 flagellar basal-body MS-ring/collar protein FliF [Thermomonas sp.]
MKLMDSLKGMSALGRTGLLVGAFVLVCGVAAALWLALVPDYRLLFGGLRERDAAEIAGSLKDWKVSYRFTEGGSGIEVPADQVYETRMRLVSAGVPSGGHVGFELFNDSDFGVTEFAQRVNYQRAVQGELERSIATLPGVESVRVHLTIRRPGLFVGQDDTSKASVVLGLASGETLAPPQVRGIRNLVASAVEGLSPSAVVVLGPNGVLQGGGSAGDDGLQDQYEEQQAAEKRIRENVGDLLEAVFKSQDFRISVDVQLNFDRVHRVSEHLIPQGEGGNGVITHREATRTGAAASAAGGETPATSSQEGVDYAHGSEREDVVKAPGSIERISVAVLVPSTLSSFDQGRLRRLVTAAAGLDEERGDLLEITPMAQPEDGRLEHPESATAVTQDRTGDRMSAPERSGAVSAMPVPWLVLVGVVSLLLGWGLSRITQPPPKRHRPEERDAILAKMRKWLAEGGDAA